MKLNVSLITLAAASLLAVSPVLGQSTLRPGAANPAQDTAAAGQEAKEAAEDAVLMQQLEASDNAPIQPQNQWAPGPPRGGGMAGVAPPGVPYQVQNWFTRRAGSAAKPLLVRTSEPEPKAQAALEEDLLVMAHLLDKALEDLPGGQRRAMPVMGIDLVFSQGASMRSLYLDNYGALFFLSVGFPLVPPPEKHQEEKPAADSAWEDARQELYGQGSQAIVAGEPGEEYSEEKVNKLKETLLASLKNASNIRDLKPNEFVTLWVSGGASGDIARSRPVKRNARVALGGDPPTAGLFKLGGDTQLVNQLAIPARRTVMTIRASKVDIDAYAKGTLSVAEFEKRARITAYTDEGAGGGPNGVVFGGGYAGRPRH